MNVDIRWMAAYLNAEWHEYIDELNGKYEDGDISTAKYNRLCAKLIAWEDVAVKRGLMRIE